MLDSLEAKDITKAQSQAAALGETPYAPLAVLDLAKAQVEAGQRDAAIATPRGAESSNPALQQILQQRLARLLIDDGKEIGRAHVRTPDTNAHLVCHLQLE